MDQAGQHYRSAQDHDCIDSNTNGMDWDGSPTQDRGHENEEFYTEADLLSELATLTAHTNSNTQDNTELSGLHQPVSGSNTTPDQPSYPFGEHLYALDAIMNSSARNVWQHDWDMTLQTAGHNVSHDAPHSSEQAAASAQAASPGPPRIHNQSRDGIQAAALSRQRAGPGVIRDVIEAQKKPRPTSSKRKTQQLTPSSSVTGRKRRSTIKTHTAQKISSALASRSRAQLLLQALEPRHREEVHKAAQDFLKRASAISVLSENNLDDVFSLIIEVARLSNERIQQHALPAAQTPEATVQPDLQVQDTLLMARLRAELEARRHRSCKTRGKPNGPIPCLRSGCQARFHDVGAWVRHIKQLCPSRLWACHIDYQFFDRPDRLADHMAKEHSELEQPHIDRLIERAPLDVPFLAECGWCRPGTFKSTNFNMFFLKHVLSHINGDLAKEPPWSKEEWRAPYPPLPAKPDRMWREPRPDDNPSKFSALPRENDSEDSDDDDYGNPGPGPSGGSAFPHGAQEVTHGHSQPQQQYSISNGTPPDGTRSQQETGGESNRQGHGDSCSAAQLYPAPGESTDTYPSSVQSVFAATCEHARLRRSWLVSTTHPLDAEAASGYRHIRTLFEGGSTYVDEVQQRRSGRLFARKCLKKSHTTPLTSETFAREVDNTRRLCHSHLVQLADCLNEMSSFSLILLPVGEMTLQQLMGKPNEAIVDSLMKWHSCLTSAVSYLHREDISLCHLDIKPSNILVKGGSIFLADFGISRIATQYHPSSLTVSKGSAVIEQERVRMTPKYAAPELIQHGFWSKHADVFALGCVFLEMATAMSRLSVSKFHRFLALVQKQTQYLPNHDSWDVARALWLWVLRTRAQPCDSADSTTNFVHRSAIAANAMLRTNVKRRPRMKTIASVFIGLSCCRSGSPVGDSDVDTAHTMTKLPRAPVMPTQALTQGTGHASKALTQDAILSYRGYFASLQQNTKSDRTTVVQMLFKAGQWANEDESTLICPKTMDVPGFEGREKDDQVASTPCKDNTSWTIICDGIDETATTGGMTEDGALEGKWCSWSRLDRKEVLIEMGWVWQTMRPSLMKALGYGLF